MFKTKSGFTIVELLIVIVVIAILAAISIAAYNGIQNRARVSSINSALSQAAKKISVWQVDNPNVSPPSLVSAGVSDNAGTSYTYEQMDNGRGYCLIATNAGTSYYILSSNSTPQEGICSGTNLLVWNKGVSGSHAPVPTASIDTSVFKTSTASMRFGPNTAGQPLRDNPQVGTVGQTYTVGLWILTDSNWNGTAANSKIRFGGSDGSQRASCSYNGVKLSWTYVSCSFTLTSAYPQVVITVGNDGSAGNIWIDDLTLTKTQ